MDVVDPMEHGAPDDRNGASMSTTPILVHGVFAECSSWHDVAEPVLEPATG